MVLLKEKLYVDDIVDACIYFMNKNSKETVINIGTGKDYTIKQYVKIAATVFFQKGRVQIKYDKSKPNGTARKVLNVSKANKLGWYSTTSKKSNRIYL